VIPIFNNTGTDRYCATLHLCPVMINGDLFDPGDIIIPGVVSPGTHDYTFEIPDYPANSGLVCFGPFIEDGRRSCPDEFDCCTIVSWNTSAQHACAPNLDPTPSKCRLQQVCIQGFGAELACVDSCEDDECGSHTDCAVACGEDLHLCASASGASTGATEGMYHFQIYDPDGDLVADSGGLVSSPQCFTIQNPKEGTYRLRATDSEECFREDTVEVTVEDVTTTLNVAGHDACNNGVLTFTAGTEEGLESCSFQWWINGEPQSETGDTLTYYPCAGDATGINTDNVTVTASAVCGECVAESASITFSQCVETTIHT
jgi:hypothetical protein